MRSSNPYLREAALRKASQSEARTGEFMTINGTLNKISLLLLVVAGCATITWNQVMSGSLASANAGAWMIGGSLGALALSLVISFRPNLAPVLAIPFAVCEGLLLGAVSAMYQSLYSGIVLNAILLTIGVSLAMFLLWRSGLIPITDKFRSVILASMGAIFLVYLATFVLGFFGVSIPFIHSNGIIGIAFSGLVLVVVSLMLMVDFDMIQKLSQSSVPKSMEWYGAFALLVTLVWLYLELLRLLSKLNRN
ncbi:MAG TPA: Bax inhibitor-1/YccA family protein [Planctomycetota bacterium]|nr:Bax inhibitor-1/YccA family protein [Planctomycetota bacterium]